MSRVANRRVVAVAVLAGGALLAGLALRPPWASAREDEPGEAVAGEAAQCRAEPTTTADEEIAALIERDLLAAQQQPGSVPGSDAVVLNNRGYHYGSPPGVRFDPVVPRRDPKPSDSAR